jgi:hypothetical protein
MASSERLNAAIEMEVSRRLKHRIAAAAMSRQALAMMRQQQLKLQRQQIQQQQQQQSAAAMLCDSSVLAGWGPATAAAALHQHRTATVTGMLPARQSALNQMLLANKRRSTILNLPVSSTATTGFMGLQVPRPMTTSLPNHNFFQSFKSNIQGAKTA